MPIVSIQTHFNSSSYDPSNSQQVCLLDHSNDTSDEFLLQAERLSHQCSTPELQSLRFLGWDECAAFSPVSWEERWQSGTESSLLARYGHFRFLDKISYEGHEALLIRYKDGQDEYPFIIHVYDDLDEMQVQLEDDVFNLNHICLTPEGEDWRLELFTALFVMFSEDLNCFEAPAQDRYRDRFEAQMMDIQERARSQPVASTASHTRTVFDPIVITPRYQRMRKKTNPDREPALELAGLSTVYHKPWKSEQILPEEEIVDIHGAFSFLPVEMVEALEVQGRLPGLTIEILEDDIMDARMGDSLAFHSWTDNYIGFKRSYIQSATIYRVGATVIHEFAHALHPRGDDVFLADYQRSLATHIDYRYYPFVSPYARKDEWEFFAESVVAYFNGEMDYEPIQDRLRGPRDRNELRRKAPEIYLAILLYLEADSLYFADKEVFTSDSLITIRELMATYPESLSAQSSPDWISQKYRELAESCEESCGN